MHSAVGDDVMPMKAFEIPKYAQIVTTVQDRISKGEYKPGSMIPSESQLMAEFAVSRPVVVRALGILQQDGWIDAEHGRGRFVRRSHAVDTRNTGAGRAAFSPEKTNGVRLLSVGMVPAPPRAATALSLDEGTTVLARTRLVTSSTGPVQLATVYLTPELAEGTDLDRQAPLAGDPIRHLSSVKGISFDYATDRIGARQPSADEARLLEISRRDVVLTILVTAFDNNGMPRLAADAIVPAARMELEDTFPLS
jgi:GntR family transcriptional regulator